MYTVYKHLNDNEEIIYIGKSKSLLYRQRQHKKNAEWFNEVDSIEYCTLSSKIEMDIIELYLINTLSPKYNKKDKRDDNIININVKELSWLEFYISELDVKEKKCVYVDEYSKFIHDNINKKDIVRLIGSNGALYSISKINKSKYKVKLDCLLGEYDFKDIVLYEPEYPSLDEYENSKV